MAAYAATKAYVQALSEALHAEGAARGVRVTALCPGPTGTGFFAAAGMAGSRFADLAMPAEAVAEAGLEGFAEGKRVVVAGWANAAAAVGAKLTPNALLVPTLHRAFGRLARKR